MSNAEINTIREYLKQHGFSNVALIDDLVDHLATEIELIQADTGADFEEAFTSAKEKLLPETPHELEIDLKLLTTQKHNIMIKKIAFIGGYLSALCLVISLFFFLKSYQSEKIHNLEVEQIKSHWRNPVLDYFKDGFYKSSDFKKMESAGIIHSTNALNHYHKFETFLTISFALFIITLLPYQFYARYQRSELELLAS
ncbi:hypothetical protein [Roseivirga pacifica]|uniref:hypothetical protein n=1 Tax=Roseivirga pacifica TaxID=1267423 RepID=UPI003BB0CC34